MKIENSDTLAVVLITKLTKQLKVLEGVRYDRLTRTQRRDRHRLKTLQKQILRGEKGYMRIDLALLMSSALWLSIASLFTGCSGLELGGKLGIYKVDERQESQRTYRQVPIKCWFVTCDPVHQVEGS